MMVGEGYQTNNYGWLTIVDYHDCNHVEVVFTATGYRTVAQSSHVLKGKVKDKLKPIVYGIGFIGEGKHKTTISGKSTKPYQTWLGILERSYSEKCHDRFPTYKGCTADKEWHNFQNFAEWFEANYINGYELDKDILVKGNKIYSPDTCKFVTHAENIIEANAKHYVFISPEGERVELYNLSQFCRDNGLNQGHMSAVHLGKQRQHKGWTIPTKTKDKL